MGQDVFSGCMDKLYNPCQSARTTYLEQSQLHIFPQNYSQIGQNPANEHGNNQTGMG